MHPPLPIVSNSHCQLLVLFAVLLLLKNDAPQGHRAGPCDTRSTQQRTENNELLSALPNTPCLSVVLSWWLHSDLLSGSL